MVSLQFPLSLDAAKIVLTVTAGTALTSASLDLDQDLDDTNVDESSVGNMQFTSHAVGVAVSAAGGPSLVWPSSSYELTVFCQKV